MNIVIAHGFAHRIRTDGSMESAPAEVTDGEVKITDRFISRTAESMDLSGGDYTVLYDMVERLSFIFQDGLRRLPNKQKAVLPPEQAVVR